MKKKKQLFLILGAVGLLAGGYLLTGTIEKEEADAAPLPPLETWPLAEADEADLTEIVLENEAGGFVLRREDGTWLVRGREELKLSPRAVAGTVAALSRLTAYERITPEAEDPAPYGLGGGAPRLVLTRTDGSETVLEIGGKAPSGSGRYVRKEGDPAVYLLPGYAAGELAKGVNDLRDRSLPGLNGEELAYLKMEGERTVEIVPFAPFEPFASDLSPFLMVRPYKRPVSVNTETLSQGMQSLLQGLAVVSFVPEGTPASVTGLDEGARTILLRDKSGAELSLRVGNEDGRGGYYCALAGESEAFTLLRETLTLLDTPVFDLSDKFVRLVGIDLIREAEVRFGGETWTAAIAAGETEEETTYFFQGGEVAEDPFKKLYQEVLYLLVEGEISGPFRPGEPEATITYRGNDENPGETRADFFDYDRDFFAVGIDGDAPEFLIGRYQLEGLKAYLKAFPPAE